MYRAASLFFCFPWGSPDDLVWLLYLLAALPEVHPSRTGPESVFPEARLHGSLVPILSFSLSTLSVMTHARAISRYKQEFFCIWFRRALTFLSLLENAFQVSAFVMESTCVHFPLHRLL